jgi:hypothetical protein
VAKDLEIEERTVGISARTYRAARKKASWSARGRP